MKRFHYTVMVLIEASTSHKYRASRAGSGWIQIGNLKTLNPLDPQQPSEAKVIVHHERGRHSPGARVALGYHNEVAGFELQR